jgi:hypothetical protein
VGVDCENIITKEVVRGKAKVNILEVMDSDKQAIRILFNTQLGFGSW